MAEEIANFVGFSQAGTPVIVRGSRKIPTADGTNATSISKAVNVRGGLEAHAFLTMLTMSTF